MKKWLIIEGIDTSWEGSSGAAERRVWEWEKIRLWSIWEVELRGGFVRDSSLSVRNAVLHDLINGVGAIAPPNPVPAIESRTRKFQFLFIVHHLRDFDGIVEINSAITASFGPTKMMRKNRLRFSSG